MGKAGKNLVDNEGYLERNKDRVVDLADFNQIKPIDPKLTFKIRESVFEYLSPDRKLSSSLFKPTTSEYKILTFLIKHRIPVDTSELIGQLNDPRKEAEGTDNKQRVRDKIKAITKKLGKGLIKKTKDGYLIDCKVDSI